MVTLLVSLECYPISPLSCVYDLVVSTTRTGCYTTDELSQDGFDPDPSRSTAAAYALAYYHSADSTNQGNITLSELTRVIELYNYRVGSVRTGQYSVATATEDGFSPGP